MKGRRAFTLLEFLVATFLGTLLLVMVYQAFSQVARHYRLLSASSELFSLMEREALRYQLTHLWARPYFREGRLVLPVMSPAGPLLAIYDLEAGTYAEELGYHQKPSPSPDYLFPGVGLARVKLFSLPAGKTSGDQAEELEELPLERPWPEGRPLLLEAEFLDGTRLKVVFKFSQRPSAGSPEKAGHPRETTSKTPSKPPKKPRNFPLRRIIGQ